MIYFYHYVGSMVFPFLSSCYRCCCYTLRCLLIRTVVNLNLVVPLTTSSMPRQDKIWSYKTKRLVRTKAAAAKPKQCTMYERTCHSWFMMHYQHRPIDVHVNSVSLRSRLTHWLQTQGFQLIKLLLPSRRFPSIARLPLLLACKVNVLPQPQNELMRQRLAS